MTPRLPIVAIIGRANVGKSSLFNRLLGERKAIVADEPGTTRDRVDGIVEWNGRCFWLVDTAGAESGSGDLESAMQAQLETAQAAADAIVLVVDGTTLLSDEDERLLQTVYKSRKPFVVAVNKSDRSDQAVERQRLPKSRTIAVSAIHGSGSGDLLDALVQQLPEGASVSQPQQPTLALLGRPNVGKSSLMNALTGSSRSIVDSAGGTTRDAVEAEVHGAHQSWRLIDTAGLRRTHKSGAIEYFSALRTARTIQDSHVCTLVIDAQEPATAQDQRIAGMVTEAGKGLILAVNKWDLLERSDSTRKQLEAQLAHQLAFVWWAPVVLTIAPQQHHTQKLLEVAETVFANRQRRLATPELNDILADAQDAHPPAGLKNQHPKLRYITQTDIEPPTFTIYGSHTRYLHWSYKRFLEGQLRDAYDFSGTPIRMQWRDKKPSST